MAWPNGTQSSPGGIDRQESLARGTSPCTHKHTLLLVSDNFSDQKDNMEEMFLGSPKDNLHLSVIPVSLDWMWLYEGWEHGGFLSPRGDLSLHYFHLKPKVT